MIDVTAALALTGHTAASGGERAAAPGAGSAQIAALDLRRHEDTLGCWHAREQGAGCSQSSESARSPRLSWLRAPGRRHRAPGAGPDRATRIPLSGLAGSLQSPCFSPDSKRIALTR